MDKKSQIQIGETIAVLFVFFILVVIGFIFYARVIKGNIDIETDEMSQLRSIAIAQRIMFLPELQCSEENIVKDNCIDLVKLQSAEEIMKKNEIYYYDLFEFSDIKVSEIYPPITNPWNLYLRATSDFKNKKDFKNKFVTNIPISIYNPSTRTNAFGILTIETYTK